MAVNPIKVWNGTAWEYTGPVVAAPPVKYQATQPTSPATGDVWVESDVDVATFDPSQIVRGGAYTNEAARSSAITSPVTGMITYVGDTGTDSPASTIPQVQAYNGTAWQEPYGLTLLATATFASASAVQLDNVFSSAYDNYKIIFDQRSMSNNDTSVNLQFVNGTTPESSLYYYGAVGVSTTGTNVSIYGSNTGFVRVAYGNSTASDVVGFTMDVVAPSLTTRTKYFWNGWSYNGGLSFSYAGGGAQELTQALEGIRITPNAGTFGGGISVYGYRKN